MSPLYPNPAKAKLVIVITILGDTTDSQLGMSEAIYQILAPHLSRAVDLRKYCMEVSFNESQMNIFANETRDMLCVRCVPICRRVAK